MSTLNQSYITNTGVQVPTHDRLANAVITTCGIFFKKIIIHFLFKAQSDT